MKRLVNLVVFFCSIAVIGLTNVACDNGINIGDFIQKEDFLGKWVNSNGVVRDISLNKMVASGSDWSYTLTINSWKAVQNTNKDTKTEYPYGYRITGIITEMNRGSLGGVPNVGEPYSQTYFLNVDKNSFSNDGGINHQIYTKQN